MKKKLVMILALILCVAIAVPVVAVASGFVPSITYKGAPLSSGISMVNADGTTVAGMEDIGNCVVVSTVEQARDKETDISQEDRDLLIEVYEKLEKGEMTLPIAGEYVIRDLVDISFLYNGCRMKADHNDKPVTLREKDVFLQMTLDLGIEADAKLMVLVYVDGAWTAVKDVENNGNGTVTCLFEDICPVAFVVLN